MTPARSLVAVWAAKGAAFASRRLGRGGTALSGLVGLQLDPDLIAELAPQLGRGSILVTGTNGKTTTSRLVAASVREAGLQPLANASGSNLVRGIASTLALAVDAAGRLPDAAERLGVFEVDEATVPLALPSLKPKAALFLNLFRDQLDRYGEVETVAALWREALRRAPAGLRLVLNADDPSVASLAELAQDDGGVAGTPVFFGIDDPAAGHPQLEHASDARSCTCGAEYEYEAAYVGHAGLWRCPACGRERPRPQVAARDIDLRDGRGLAFTLCAGETAERIEMGLGGLYSVYNALAAVAASIALDLPLGAATAALGSTEAAFGRQEWFEVDGRRVELYLGKNPAGVNQVISTLLLDPARKTALVLLNDNIADGRDISWIWDADFEALAGRFASVVAGGTRAEEMALRLKYAEWEESSIAVVPDIAAALERALQATPPGECLTVVPTYTAMLTVRDLLARRSGRDPFWRDGSA